MWRFFLALIFLGVFWVCVWPVRTRSRFFGFAAVRVRWPTAALFPTRKGCSIYGESFTGKAWARFYSGLALSRDTSFGVFFLFFLVFFTYPVRDA